MECAALDKVHLNFSPQSLIFLDITLFIIMFGVALSLKPSDFVSLWQRPKPALVGIISQFLLLPAITLLLVTVIQPCPSIALGMFLVAACPGGNVSNFISQMAQGNVALSVSLSALSTTASMVMTPFTFLFWAQWYAPAAAMLEAISLDPLSIILKILVILGIPLVLGMIVAQSFPKFTAKIQGPMKTLSLIIFGGYIVAALAGNWEAFKMYVQYIVGYVVIHNALALAGGYFLAHLAQIKERDRRTVAIETGIQNSGLALVLIFGPIFNGMGGMAMIAALWGIWHIVAGLSVASIWSRLMPLEPTQLKA
ncbi:MAG: bile acid:sodium symporter family protein [Bacteroidia bacterium]|nr:bile acid:sodium symporter family protein [Bacteroidia bacterium]